MNRFHTLSLSLAAALALPLTAQAPTATLSASPAAYSGKCPTTITFNGSITAPKAGKLQYKFIRSDNANAPIQTLEFDKPGTKPVSTTWTLGGPGLPEYEGWQAIQIVYPQQVTSNRAVFKVKCVAEPLRVMASLKATPEHFQGKCPAIIKFDGSITVSQATTVKYRFTRSDGAQAPEQSLVFAAPGTKPVSTTWTLGGPQLPSYEGWQAIEVIVPLAAASNKAAFKVTCVDEGAKKADVGAYGFLKIGKKQKEVRWNETLVLTPDDATLVSNGKPAFELYYAIREYNGAAAPGPFKCKWYFNGSEVSIQSTLALAANEIKPIHTQAYLGPQEGTLELRVDADGVVTEAREDNNTFRVKLQFRGF